MVGDMSEAIRETAACRPNGALRTIVAEHHGYRERNVAPMRHLAAQFRTEIGLTPKAAARVIRFDRARRLIRTASGADVAAACGYFDQLHHAQLCWPLGGGIMLGSTRPAEGDSWPITPGTFAAYVVVDDPDAVFERVRAGGAEITDALHETDYGSRDFAIRDPEGNRWSFGTYRGEPRTG
jgi:uncharacterized glyoxalase superfamily protein PhnB